MAAPRGETHRRAGADRRRPGRTVRRGDLRRRPPAGRGGLADRGGHRDLVGNDEHRSTARGGGGWGRSGHTPAVGVGLGALFEVLPLLSRSCAWFVTPFRRLGVPSVAR